VFYRGLHCPICKALRDLESKLDEFAKRGVAVVAMSSDTKGRATETTAAWGLLRLCLDHGLDLVSARQWGIVHLNGAPNDIGRALFGASTVSYSTLHFGNIQNYAVCAPHFSDFLAAIDYVLKNNSPARGEATITALKVATHRALKTLRKTLGQRSNEI